MSKNTIDTCTGLGLLLALAAGLWAGSGYWLAGLLVGGLGAFCVLLLGGFLQLLLVRTDIPVRRFGHGAD